MLKDHTGNCLEKATSNLIYLSNQHIQTASISILSALNSGSTEGVKQVTRSLLLQKTHISHQDHSEKNTADFLSWLMFWFTHTNSNSLL